MKVVPIGNLFNSLQVIETRKGVAKLAEKEAKALQGEFVAIASGIDTQFVSTTGQELASVKYQTRATLDAKLLAECGVDPLVIARCTVQSEPFAVMRIH